MSPTWALLGMPPRAMTAQFSNSKWGSPRSRGSVQGRSRTTNPLSTRQSFSSSSRWQRSFSRLAITRQAVGEMSIPTHWRPRFSAATKAVPQPQKASRTTSPSFVLERMSRSSSISGFWVG